MNEELKVLGCSLKSDRLYRIEVHRMLFQWIRDEGSGVYAVGMMSLLAALTYPIYSIKVKPLGTELEIDENLAIVETGKRVATFPTPISGNIVEVNEEAVEDPQLVNRKPYTYWLAKLEATEPEELKNLKTAKDAVVVVREIIINNDIDCSVVEE